MALPLLGLGARGLMSLLGRGMSGRAGQSAMGRALGNKRLMPFKGATAKSLADLGIGKKATQELNTGRQTAALLALLGATPLMMAKNTKKGEDINVFPERRPDMIGVSEGPAFGPEDLVMRGGTNEPVRTGPDNENYLTYGLGGDEEEIIGEIDLLRLLGIK
mgnify:CR=1 FL=1|tara:strand:+ start:528 stop:1013 length:486 start_codon:yes stop_codon:yes gene_type:complete